MEEDDNFENMDDTAAGGQIWCEICGSDKFSSQGGFFFCEVCQTQSQDARQYVEKEDFVPNLRVTRAATLRDRATKEKPPPKQKISTFEAFNCMLKIATDRLIQAGFPAELKDVVFDLWTRFLERRKAVFVSHSGKGADYLRSAANQSHGKYCSCSFREKAPRKRGQKKVVPNQQAEDFMLSTSLSKRKRTTEQRRAMETDYSSQLAELMGEVQETEADSVKTNKRVRKQCKLTKHSKIVLRSMRDQGLTSRKAREIVRPELVSFQTMLVFVFMALRQLGFSILMTDVARMVWTGLLYFSSLRLVFGEVCTSINTIIDNLFQDSCSFAKLADHSDQITDMIMYLGISDFPLPQFREFIPKFLDDFALPREMECLLLQMQKVLPVDNEKFFSCRRFNLSGYRSLPEFHILSFIILVLRLLFGMDDVTERYQAEFARKVNQLLRPKLRAKGDPDWIKLFDVQEWFSYIRRRKWIFYSEMMNPAIYQVQRTPPSPPKLNNLIKFYGGHKGINYERENEEKFRTSVQDMFGKYARTNPNFESPTPNYNPISLPQENVIRQYKASYPNVLDAKFGVTGLENDFMTSRIDFILNPKKYVALLRKAGHRVKVLKGHAAQYPNLADLERDCIILFQPFKSYDDYMPKFFAYPSSLKFIVRLCSRILSGAPEPSLLKFEILIDQMHFFYSRHLKAGNIQIFPYDMSDAAEVEFKKNKAKTDNKRK